MMEVNRQRLPKFSNTASRVESTCAHRHGCRYSTSRVDMRYLTRGTKRYSNTGRRNSYCTVFLLGKPDLRGPVPGAWLVALAPVATARIGAPILLSATAVCRQHHADDSGHVDALFRGDHRPDSRGRAALYRAACARAPRGGRPVAWALLCHEGEAPAPRVRVLDASTGCEPVR